MTHFKTECNATSKYEISFSFGCLCTSIIRGCQFFNCFTIFMLATPTGFTSYVTPALRRYIQVISDPTTCTKSNYYFCLVTYRWVDTRGHVAATKRCVANTEAKCIRVVLQGHVAGTKSQHLHTHENVAPCAFFTVFCIQSAFCA